jgi:hypothetical protein
MMQGSLKVERKPFIGNGILNAGPMKKFNVSAREEERETSAERLQFGAALFWHGFAINNNFQREISRDHFLMV